MKKKFFLLVFFIGFSAVLLAQEQSDVSLNKVLSKSSSKARISNGVHATTHLKLKKAKAISIVSSNKNVVVNQKAVKQKKQPKVLKYGKKEGDE